MQLEFLSEISSFIGGIGLSSIVIAIINKVKSKGEKRNEFADFLDKINTLFSNTIETVTSTYQTIIESEKEAVEIANKNFEMSQLREERQLQIINQERKRSERLELKNAKKRGVINKAYECSIVKESSNPAEVCAVLKANEDYYHDKHTEKVHKCNECITTENSNVDN